MLYASNVKMDGNNATINFPNSNESINGQSFDVANRLDSSSIIDLIESATGYLVDNEDKMDLDFLLSFNQFSDTETEDSKVFYGLKINSASCLVLLETNISSVSDPVSLSGKGFQKTYKRIIVAPV